MKLTRTWYLLLTASLLFSCRSREDSAVQSGEASSESKFSGRVAVFDIYDKTTKSTRQAPGIMVATRGALISGLKPEETVTLSDDKRKGEKYFPLNAGDIKLTFVGLEAPPAAALALAPVAPETLPPLSAQVLKPLNYDTPLRNFIQGHDVIMYNDIGYIIGYAVMQGDKINISYSEVRSYDLIGGIGNAIFNLLFGKMEVVRTLDGADAERMIRKGGAIILRDPPPGRNYTIHIQEKYWKFRLDGKPDPATVDIVAFFDEDNSSILKQHQIIRKDALSLTIRDVMKAAEVKFKMPVEVERQIIELADCKHYL